MANNKSNTVDDILYMLLAEFENHSEEYKAMAHAIKCVESVESMEKKISELEALCKKVLKWGKDRNFSPDCESGKMIIEIEKKLGG